MHLTRESGEAIVIALHPLALECLKILSIEDHRPILASYLSRIKSIIVVRLLEQIRCVSLVVGADQVVVALHGRGMHGKQTAK